MTDEINEETIYIQYKGIKITLKRLIEVAQEKEAEEQNADVVWNKMHKKKEIDAGI